MAEEPVLPDGKYSGCRASDLPLEDLAIAVRHFRRNIPLAEALGIELKRRLARQLRGGRQDRRRRIEW